MQKRFSARASRAILRSISNSNSGTVIHTLGVSSAGSMLPPHWAIITTHFPTLAPFQGAHRKVSLLFISCHLTNPKPRSRPIHCFHVSVNHKCAVRRNLTNAFRLPIEHHESVLPMKDPDRSIGESWLAPFQRIWMLVKSLEFFKLLGI